MTASLHDLHRERGSTRPLPIPDALDAEQAVLGAILLNNHVLAAVAPHVGADDFAEDLHRRIFDVAAQLIAVGQPARPATLKPYLGDAEITDGVTVGDYLAHLVADAMPPSEATGAAKLIRSIAGRRKLIGAASALDERARDVSRSARQSSSASTQLTRHDHGRIFKKVPRWLWLAGHTAVSGCLRHAR